MNRKTKLFPVVPSCSGNRFRRSSQLFPYIGGNNSGNNYFLNRDSDSGTTQQPELFDGYRPLIWPRPRRKGKQIAEDFKVKVQAVLECYGTSKVLVQEAARAGSDRANGSQIQAEKSS